MENLLKDLHVALEQVQIIEASQDSDVIKHLPNKQVSTDSWDDIILVAKHLDITPQDVIGLLNYHGDWDRVAKKFNINPIVIKAVKVAFGGVCI